jgi:hypothetical protein
MAIHAAAVVTMGIVALKVRLRLETRVFVLWHRVRDGQTRFGPHRSGIP